MVLGYNDLPLKVKEEYTHTQTQDACDTHSQKCTFNLNGQKMQNRQFC